MMGEALKACLATKVTAQIYPKTRLDFRNVSILVLYQDYNRRASHTMDSL